MVRGGVPGVAHPHRRLRVCLVKFDEHRKRRDASVVALSSLGLLASVGETIDAFFPEMVSVWRASGVNVQTAAGTPTMLDGTTVLRGVTRNPSPANLLGILTTRAWAKESRLDALITNTATASAIARLTDMKTPVVYFCHGLHWADHRLRGDVVWQVLEEKLLGKTSGVIVINSSDEAWFARHAPSVPRLRLDFGVGLDTNNFPRSAPANNETLHLVWIGEFIPRKRPGHALEVAHILAGKGVKFQLDMLGDGPLWDESRATVERLSLSGMVRLHGRRPTYDYLKVGDALIHTASWEGLPRVMLEALAVGRPIFSYDVKGPRDLPMTHLVPSGDIAALADAICEEREPRAMQAYPPPEALSSAMAARRILDFLQSEIVP